ncbi:MAG: hypothetical protein KBC87_02580 [Candidatus Pacebacteria bacterium]|nr:hypothetical protein [Candidatus Paceibacterota bacterium]
MKRQFVFPNETFVRLLFHSGLVQGESTEGSFKIEGLGIFDFEIINFGVPKSDSSGGTVINIIYQDGTILSTFHPGDPDPFSDPHSKFFGKAFLVALAASEDKIEGIAPGEFAPYPIPAHVKCIPGMK